VPEASVLELVGIAVALLLAGLLQGMTGFGFALVSMATLPFLIGARAASVIVPPFAVLNTLALLWSLRRHINVAWLWRLLLGAAIGVPMGVYLLTSLPDVILRRFIGVVLLGYCASEVWRGRAGGTDTRGSSAWWSLPLGWLAGLISGAVNAGGPPVVVYIYRQPWKRDAIRATLCAFFMCVALYKTALVFGALSDVATPTKGGMLLRSPTLYLTAGPAMWFGGFVGLRLGSRLSRDRFTAYVLVALAGLAVMLFVK